MRYKVLVIPLILYCCSKLPWECHLSTIRWVVVFVYTRYIQNALATSGWLISCLAFTAREQSIPTEGMRRFSTTGNRDSTGVKEKPEQCNAVPFRYHLWELGWWWTKDVAYRLGILRDGWPRFWFGYGVYHIRVFQITGWGDVTSVLWWTGFRCAPSTHGHVQSCMRSLLEFMGIWSMVARYLFAGGSRRQGRRRPIRVENSSV